MMRRISLLTTAALMVAASTFVGCSASVELAEEPNTVIFYDSTKTEAEVNWKGENGTLELMNNTNKDIVIFKGATPTKDGILGGIRAGTTKLFDVSDDVDDFPVGGYMILRGVTREEYERNKNTLSQAKMEFSAMATYKANTKYRIAIEADYTGDYGFIVSNTGRVGLELRKDGPEGEKVGYLPPLQVNQYIYTNTTNAITIFPVYVYYSKQTQTITTLKATDMFQSVMVSPRPIAGASQVPTFNFPNDPNATWAAIVGTLKSPVAYITIRNNVMNQSAYVTAGGSMRLFSQSGYDALGSGEQLTYEIEASEFGAPISIVLNYYNGLIKVPVLFDGELTPPIIKNGYDYTISVSCIGAGTKQEDYVAYISESPDARDLSGEIL